MTTQKEGLVHRSSQSFTNQEEAMRPTGKNTVMHHRLGLMPQLTPQNTRAPSACSISPGTASPPLASQSSLQENSSFLCTFLAQVFIPNKQGSCTMSLTPRLGVQAHTNAQVGVLTMLWMHFIDDVDFHPLNGGLRITHQQNNGKEGSANKSHTHTDTHTTYDTPTTA
eukprot:scaffold73007_cov23-Tisochrysis_lutea.AAC.1